MRHSHHAPEGHEFETFIKAMGGETKVATYMLASVGGATGLIDRMLSSMGGQDIVLDLMCTRLLEESRQLYPVYITLDDETASNLRKMRPAHLGQVMKQGGSLWEMIETARIKDVSTLVLTFATREAREDFVFSKTRLFHLSALPHAWVLNWKGYPVVAEGFGMESFTQAEDSESDVKQAEPDTETAVASGVNQVAGLDPERAEQSRPDIELGAEPDAKQTDTNAKPAKRTRSSAEQARLHKNQIDPDYMKDKWEESNNVNILKGHWQKGSRFRMNVNTWEDTTRLCKEPVLEDRNDGIVT